MQDSVPIEDIDIILLENRQTLVSSALLGYLGQNGTALLVCDETHTPCAVLLPYMQHSRQLEVAQKQLSLTNPTKKRLWKQIVTAKISNQAECLHLQGKSAVELHNIAKNVKSGDSTNAEGHAAAKYFVALFGKGFTRNADNTINSQLNYGYAILRGCVARTLAVYGFLPAFGLHHKSGLNQFNLADDFIEPFRQIVDLYVASQPTAELNPQVKRDLLNLLNYNIEILGKKYTVSYAIEKCVQSFSAVVAGNKADLQLPKLIPLEPHKYE